MALVAHFPCQRLTFAFVPSDCGKQWSQRCSNDIPSAQLIPLESCLLACKLDNSVDAISIKVTLKTISWYDTPRADRRGDQRKRPLTCRWYQTWCGIHYCISPSKCVTCLFTPLGVLIILRRIWRKSYPRWLWNAPSRRWEKKGGGDFIFSFANELLDELI